MDSVFDIIEAMIEGKRAAKKPPFIALYPEIAAHYSGPDLQGELGRLVDAGMLVCGPTVNSTYYKLKP